MYSDKPMKSLSFNKIFQICFEKGQTMNRHKLVNKWNGDRYPYGILNYTNRSFSMV